MWDQKQRYLVLEQGRTNKQWFRVTNSSTGAVIDLEAAGYVSGKLQVRDRVASEDGALLLELETGSGAGDVNIEYIADDGTGKSWSGYIYCTPDSTDDIDPWEDAIYDLIVIHASGDIETVSRGPAMLIPMVTTT